jgi:hypothetical protein
MRPKPYTQDGVTYPSQRAAAAALGVFSTVIWRRALQAKDPEKYRLLRRKWAGWPEPTRPCPETCEICGKPPAGLALNLDHDHLTKSFRGWLCGNCNRALGLFNDDPQLLRKAVRYLVKSLL